MRVKPEKWRNACLSAVSSFKNTRLRICNLHKCWQLTIVATFAIIVIARFSSSATSWMNFNTRMNIWTRWIELERTWGLGYWLYQPKNWGFITHKIIVNGVWLPFQRVPLSIWPIFGCLLGIYRFTFWEDWNLNIIHFRRALAWSHSQVLLANQNQDFSCRDNSHALLPFYYLTNICYGVCYDVWHIVTTVVTMF